MNLEYVREFICLAKIQNYMEAADILCISQSSLSKHIQAIEAELGAQLFERSARKVKLNEAGKTFLAYADRLMDTWQDCADTFRSLSGKRDNSLTIASFPMMTQYGITDLLSEFLTENPAACIDVTEGTYYQMLELLQEQKCDFAFVRENDPSIEEFRHIQIAKDHLVAVLPVTHSMAARKRIGLEELKGEAFLFPVKDTRTYAFCIRACRKARFEPKVIFTSRGASTNIDLVKKGMGVALLMRKTAEAAADPDVTLVDLQPETETGIYLLYNKKKKLNHAALKFIGMFSEENA